MNSATADGDFPADVRPLTAHDPAALRRRLQLSVGRAALGVLVAANLVGLWLAALLLWPRLGIISGPLTYGRWVPVHLDLQLYGWCSLPVIGLLLARFLPSTAEAMNAARAALAAWCGALAAGALAWLAGRTTGKIFLDWSGPAALAFAAAQLLLWSVLTTGWLQQFRSSAASDRRIFATWRRVIDGVLLLTLLGVPIALYLAAQPSVYPPVNPDSGGATGHSLLASSLGIIGLGLALPALLGRPAVQPLMLRRRAAVVLIPYLANWMFYALLNHGNASHHETPQIAGLATLLVWPGFLVWWFRQFAWTAAHLRWLLAAAAWAALLVLDGFALFLPGVLEQLKFTNALVAHSHLAMAGLLTSLNLLMLISLAPASRFASALAARGPWLAWNFACLTMIAVLTLLGWREGSVPRLTADGAALVTVSYVVRLVTGAAMFFVSVHWFSSACFPPEIPAQPKVDA